MQQTTHWHSEVSGIVLRGYHEPDGYSRTLRYIAVCYVKCLGVGEVFIEAFLRLDGADLTVGDLRGIARLLREQHGVETIRAKRSKKNGETRLVEWSTSRA